MTRCALLLALALVALAPASAHAALPTINYTLAGNAGDNGWYRGPVTINWAISGDATDIDCTTIETIRDDTPGATRTCSATNASGTNTAQTAPIRIDQTAPTVTAATPARPPDAPPFYTAPVAITWSGTDATSGVASCTSTTYAGPDTVTAAPTGTCRDKAGNVAPPLALPFAYDATAPPLTSLTATAAADRTIALAWTTSPDAQTATVVRNPGNTIIMNAGPATTHAVTDGPLAPATAYTYAVTLKDAAGNATTAGATATTPASTAAASKSATSKAKAKAKQRRVLRWKAQPRANYYNFQLFRNGRKVLSAWPTKNHYTLHTTWRYRGKAHHLAAGRYRWYVWPGYGRRASHRYGHLHAKGAVAVPTPTKR